MQIQVRTAFGLFLLGVLAMACSPPSKREKNISASDSLALEQAKINGKLVNEGLERCSRFVADWLVHADSSTGLIPRNLGEGFDIWNAKDAAADNYPFMVLTAALTDEDLFKGRMLYMLRTETRLTSRIGNLLDT